MRLETRFFDADADKRTESSTFKLPNQSATSNAFESIVAHSADIHCRSACGITMYLLGKNQRNFIVAFSLFVSMRILFHLAIGRTLPIHWTIDKSAFERVMRILHWPLCCSVVIHLSMECALQLSPLPLSQCFCGGRFGLFAVEISET